MTTTLHIVHPYTYKIEEYDGKYVKLGRGSSKQYAERNERVVSFVRSAGHNRVCHHMGTLDARESAEHLGALVSDQLFHFILDPKVRSIVTTDKGTTIPDVKPERIKQANWESLRKIFSSDSALRAASGTSNVTFFIGGLLEGCLTGAMEAYDRICRQSGEAMYCVQDLCVSQREMTPEVKKYFAERDVHFIDAQEAICLANPHFSKV